jgi:metal-responsive CopG/Arc/MetJ family transcriptional regulator
MAKVAVSLPDLLLRAVDVEARRRGTTRSGYLRALAEEAEALGRRSCERADGVAEIHRMAGRPSGHGGTVAALVKAN